MLQLHLSDQQFYCLSRCGLYWWFDGMHHRYCQLNSVQVYWDTKRQDVTLVTDFPYLFGVSPLRCQAIAWTNADLSLIGPLLRNRLQSYFKMKIKWISLKKIPWKWSLQNVGQFMRASTCLPNFTQVYCDTTNGKFKLNGRLLYWIWLLVKTSTNRNVDNQNVDKPKRRQTETSTDQNVNKPKRRQTKTSTNRNVDKPKRPKASTNQNFDTLKFGIILMIYCIYHQYPRPSLDNWIKGMGGQLRSTAGPQLEPLKLWYGLVITFHRFRGCNYLSTPQSWCQYN